MPKDYWKKCGAKRRREKQLQTSREKFRQRQFSMTNPEPTASITSPQPITSMTSPQPITSMTSPQLTTSMPFPQPTTSMTSPQPTTSMTSPQPTTSMTSPQPTTSMPSPQHISSVSSQQQAISTNTLRTTQLQSPSTTATTTLFKSPQLVTPIRSFQRKTYGRSQRGDKEYTFEDVFKDPSSLGTLPIEYASPTVRREELSATSPHPLPEGRRLITIGSLEDALNKSARHRGSCTDAQFDIIQEKRNGLESELTVKCRVCGIIAFKISNDSGKKKSLPINEATVWATHAAAVGFTAIETICSILDVPCISRSKFSRLESTEFQQTVEEGLIATLLENGREEAQLARDLGQIEWILVDGEIKEVAYTDVFGDGQWSKRSYNQAGTANSGAAGIIGLLSKKLLFVGVRNKFCYMCTYWKNKSEPIPEHKCYMNWSGSSSAMETDIILEGFNTSIATHGLVYKRFIGDGDSSVYNSIRSCYLQRQTNFITVEKINCKNHALRCLKKHLYETLKLTKAVDVHLRKLLEKRITTICNSVTYLIEHSCQRPECNATTLKNDIKNIPFHAFGEHKNCKPYYCNPVTKKIIVPDKFKTAYSISQENKRSVLAWNNILHKVRHTTLWKYIEDPIERLSDLSVSLMYNLTTNIAESFMGQINKALGGRRINYSNRGGYNMRVATSALATTEGRGWPAALLKRKYGKSPIGPFKKLQVVGLKEKRRIKKSKAKKRLFPENDCEHEEFYSKRPELRLFNNPSYGVRRKEADLPEDILLAKIENYMVECKVDKYQQRSIERRTVNQFENEEYKIMKKKTITASLAKKIFSLKISTPNVSVLDSILEPAKLNIDAIAHGIKFEETARQEYNKSKTIQQQASKCGLFLSLQHGYLGASPDGIIEENGRIVGIIEIKCPFSIKDSKPNEAKFLVIRPGPPKKNISRLMLDRKHDYYYQVVMQLNVTEAEWCDFVVWTHRGLLVDRIYRKDTTILWTKMESKMVTFFREDLAPELMDSRYDRSRGYRQPTLRLAAIRAAEAKREETKQRNTTAALKSQKNRISRAIVATSDNIKARLRRSRQIVKSQITTQTLKRTRQTLSMQAGTEAAKRARRQAKAL